MNDEPSFGLDINIFLTVIETGAAEHRVALAVQLASFLAGEATPDGERSQVVPIVLKLAVDPVSDVRKTLAEALSPVRNLNADVVFSIISDEDEIALPFLAATPSLNHWHMLAVLRVGDVARQCSVALRSDLSAEARAFILKSAGIEVVLALFDNPSVRFNTEEYHALYGRFGQTGDIVERLLTCADLPLDIRILQAKRASNRMHQLLAERGWVPANDAAELVADAEETAMLRILVEANEVEIASVVPFLVTKAMLTPSIVVRAACLGEMHVVEWALAHLAGLPVAKARDAMQGRGLMRFRALYGKSGLPSACFGILQAAADVANDEREEGIALDSEGFGRRLIEALMTRYESMELRERSKHLEIVGRLAEDRVRLIARRLKADLVRAA